MERFDRIFRLNQILQNARVPVSHKTLEAELECSRATVTRIIEDLRDYLGAPLIYDREANGYRYDGEGEHPYQLPGLWFSEAELHALLTMQQLLADLQPGLLDDQLAPLRERVEVLLQDRRIGGDGEISRRVRILGMAARPAGECFRAVAAGVLERRRLRLSYRIAKRHFVSLLYAPLQVNATGRVGRDISFFGGTLRRQDPVGLRPWGIRSTAAAPGCELPPTGRAGWTWTWKRS